MRAAKRLILGISVFCVLLPTEVFAAYKCMNPAICRAVCGSETCGKIAASNRDMKALESLMPKGPSGKLANSAGKSSTGSSANSEKSYTCMNPAICIAICGKETCP